MSNDINFIHAQELRLEDLGNGVKRKILAYSENMMAVEVHFEQGAIGAMHNHPHEQLTYVLSGEFEFTIGDKTQTVKAGDVLYKQPNIIHGCRCLQAGVLLDNFTPMRKDFI
ncbi:Cupin domain-containing protein [Pasteurella testudinis DSM 23072]|uniref:Cupin domain-containing protein n=1 Tax=Pasteurella testudinis DSM 23072 TaxID=1122938 RepID=A0A1W1UPT1_9PAST|nr:cupin domain-containing protein [Pasteurella testudinis]SMB82714.1 Cupin domain-containing protein [Pasteurella testudinis DSM 23072]SUB52745.1 bicupin, oxalate decarboxylase family [Pasteurella testudinis]